MAQATFPKLPIRSIISRLLVQDNQRGKETYGQHSVVRVEKGIGDDVPCGVPRYFLFVNEDTHQLGNSERRVGVV
jgi:hypothetical protein